MSSFERLFDALPEDLSGRVLSHASWTSRRSDSWERLAFLGDSVLELAISTHLLADLDPEAWGAGQLTRLRADVVNGAACRRVGERLELDRRLRERAPAEVRARVEELLHHERTLASVTEAAIGACHLHHGYAAVAGAVVEAFGPEIDEAIANPHDHKTRLQELQTGRGGTVAYEVVEAEGPPHRPTFVVRVLVDGEERGNGRGRSKKVAEQEAAAEALRALGA